MAYRRRHPEISKPISTAIEKQQIGNLQNPPPPDDDWNWDSSSSVSLAAKAIRASSAHRGSSLSSAYATGGGRGDLPSMNASPTSTSFASRYSNSNPTTFSSPSPSISSSSKDSKSYEYTSMKKLNEPRRNESKNGLWGVLARKAKAFLDDENESQQFDSPERTTVRTTAGATGVKKFTPDQSHENHQKADSPSIQKKLSAFTSSINHIGGTIGNALEEGLMVVENRTVGIIEETRKHIKKNPGQSGQAQKWQPQMQTDIDLQLKASRDVAMAMAAKAKLLLRELKTVKADLAFAKERCAHLEEENKFLHENRERGDNPEDDDLIRLQLESLLAEKARLAHENSVYARENRFLREVVEYHQLTMQDVVYLDESTEEVTEVYPTKVISSNPLPSQDVKGVYPSAAE